MTSLTPQQQMEVGQLGAEFGLIPKQLGLRELEPPAYEAPAHEDVDLATVLPEDVGLDPDDMESPLAKAIYTAHAKKTDPLPLLPAELKAKPNWVRWKLETVNGRLTKVPYQANGA